MDTFKEIVVGFWIFTMAYALLFLVFAIAAS